MSKPVLTSRSPYRVLREDAAGEHSGVQQGPFLMRRLLTLIAAGLTIVSLPGCASPTQAIVAPTAAASPTVTATSMPEVAPMAAAAAQRSAAIKLEDCTIGSGASEVPVWVLNAEEDAQNPPENVAQTATVYPNSKVLFEPYRSHYTVNWSCLAQVYTEFVELGNVTGLKADCLSKVRPSAFDVRP
jgi:hypothetical protein